MKVPRLRLCSSGRVVPPLAAGRSPTDEFIFVILQSCFIEILIA